MGTLAVTEELHAKQQEAARKEAAARKAPQDAATDAKGAGEPASKKGFGRPEQSSSRSGGRACRAQAGRPGDGPRWDTGTRRRRPAAQAGAAADRRKKITVRPRGTLSVAGGTDAASACAAASAA